MINKILFVTLSNIGDVILTLPALDLLMASFPEAKITVMAGARAADMFENNPFISRVVIFNKSSRLREKIKFFNELKKEKFDLVVDLRNSYFGAFLPARFRAFLQTPIPKNMKHMRDRHLNKVKNQISLPCRQAGNLKIESIDLQKKSLFISGSDGEYINKILKENKIYEKDKVVVIAPGARSHIKRWAQEKFAELIAHLVEEFKAKVVLVGDRDDIPAAGFITQHSRYSVVDLSGKTNIRQLACLIKRANCVITNDSACLHLASYLDVPTVAIFGPTNEFKYGPWSSIKSVVKKNIICRPCEKAQCEKETIKCMQFIKAEDVISAVRGILSSSLPQQSGKAIENKFKRILIVRTDRIGDVVLSTPVVKSLRQNYPDAYIAMMVSPLTKEIVDNNPYLDEVIIYDKDALHKNWSRSMKFARNLKKKRFDLAIILHPSNRVHLVTFFAGIPKRVGYNRKFGALLTDKIKHVKQFGEKHELEYNLDLLRYLGIEVKDKSLVFVLKRESEDWVDELFRQELINKTDRLLAIHPGASCPSKVWPAQRFAESAEALAEIYGFKVLLLAGPKDGYLAQDVLMRMRNKAINLAGKTSVSQLASILKRCSLVISNDSGPVHIATAVGIPVISIFGRNQSGLSPRRWGPVGNRDKLLHKEVGCAVCLAHNCVKGFACLKAITVGDVLEAAGDILK